MRMTDDLTSRRAVFLKGWLFLLLGAMASAGISTALEPPPAPYVASNLRPRNSSRFGDIAMRHRMNP
jgi:hypothetical protein